MDPVNQAYAESIFEWKCTICGLYAKDQVGLEMDFIENEKVVLSESDNTKWVRCYVCDTKYHLACTTALSEQVVAKQPNFVCTFMGCK